MNSIASIAIAAAFLIGYIMNIIALAQSHGMSGMVILRAVGILVAPLGSILGYF